MDCSQEFVCWFGHLLLRNIWLFCMFLIGCRSITVVGIHKDCLRLNLIFDEPCGLQYCTHGYLESKTMWGPVSASAHLPGDAWRLGSCHRLGCSCLHNFISSCHRLIARAWTVPAAAGVGCPALCTLAASSADPRPS